MSSVFASTIGSRTLGITYPLLALTIGASPMQVGWVTFALTVPGLLFYMLAGVLADRIDPRSIMMFTETVRGFTILTICLAILFGQVTIAHIVLAALLEGGMLIAYTLAETALLAKFIPLESTTRGLALSETGIHFAVLAGRPLGGVLFQCGALVAFAVNAVLFLFSGGILSAIIERRKARRPRLSSAAKAWQGVRRVRIKPIIEEISEGFHELRRHRFLRHAIAATTSTNLAINTIIVIFLTGSAGLSPILVGLVLAMGGIGGLIGSNLTRLAAVARFIRPSLKVLAIQMWVWVFAVGITTLAEPVYYGLATLVTGFTGSLINVSIRAYELRNVERAKLARVVSVHRLASHGAVCLAAPVGGWLATVTNGSHEGPMLVFMFTLLCAFACSFVMPRWRRWRGLLNSS